jgi:hypothetical protein
MKPTTTKLCLEKKGEFFAGQVWVMAMREKMEE